MIQPQTFHWRSPLRRGLRALHCAIAICALVLPRMAFAGDWHSGAHLVCNDCHTNHNSSGGQPMRYDDVAAPATYLLRAESAQTLCLSCHDGANASAPDVMGTITYISDPAGGAFANAGGVMVDHAHNLNPTVPQIPPGGTEPMILTCTTCHDPHGNDNYRNLRPDPAKTGGAGVTVVAHQTVSANGNNPAAVYGASNIIYKSGTSQWCQNCHGAPQNHNDFADDQLIFGSALASYARWSAVTLPRVPVHSPNDDIIPSPDDRVVCLSCHKAHGSANTKSLIYADGATLESTCQECHDQ
jgi:predicted CXXCH cytochrome family protein